MTLEECMAEQHKLMAAWWSVDLDMLGRWVAIPGCECDTCNGGGERGPRGRHNNHFIASQIAVKKGVEPLAVLGCDCGTCERINALEKPTEPLVRAFERRQQLVEDDALVSRTLSCPTCRREFCRVMALENVAIHVICEGCIREGR